MSEILCIVIAWIFERTLLSAASMTHLYNEKKNRALVLILTFIPTMHYRRTNWRTDPPNWRIYVHINWRKDTHKMTHRPTQNDAQTHTKWRTETHTNWRTETHKLTHRNTHWRTDPHKLTRKRTKTYNRQSCPLLSIIKFLP